MKHIKNESISSCELPAQVQYAHRVGGPVSSLSYSLPLQVLQPRWEARLKTDIQMKWTQRVLGWVHRMMLSSFSPSRPHFSLDVRTRSPEGLLFFAATRGGQSHLALYMSKGRIRLSVAKQKEIFNREKYNDGKWHSVCGYVYANHIFVDINWQKKTSKLHSSLLGVQPCISFMWELDCLQVVFSLEKKKFRLVVDGIKAQDGQLTSAELKSMQQFISPVYLGSAPASFHKELKVRKKNDSKKHCRSTF